MSKKFGKIGSDIEFLVLNRYGTPVPAGVLDTFGTKGNPEPLDSGGVEIDCCGLEITPEASSDPEVFALNILSLKRQAAERFKGFDFKAQASHEFSPQMIFGTRLASVMGCSPDFNAWTGDQNPIPRSTRPGLRSFGGHIHVEFGTELTVKAMDLLLGTWSVMADKDRDRRELYGKAGAFRPKPYGIEYRVLSNFWAEDEHLIKMAFSHTRMAQSLSRSMVMGIVRHFGGPEVIQSAINVSDTDTCKAIYNHTRAMVA